MNERPQSGSADLTDSVTIELMQHQRLIESDNHDKNDSNYPLNGSNNETDKSDGSGVRVNAK